MTEDDTTATSSLRRSSKSSAALSANMLDDDDASTSSRELMIEPPSIVYPQHVMCAEKNTAAAAAAAAAIVKSSRRSSSSRKSSVILLFVIVVAVLLITYIQTTFVNETYEQIKFQIRFSYLVVRSIYNIVSVNRRKRKGLNVNNSAAAKSTSSSIEGGNSTNRRHTWPDPPLDLFQNSTRLIWAYWHSGEANLSPLCQVSLKSWKAHHPNWQIIILSDDTYHHYVPANHIPSTFYRLKVQFRSDIVRLSVLARYGGAYLDMTTLMFKSLDGIWDSELKRVEERGGRNRVFVPTVLELGERLIEDDDDGRDDDSLRIDSNPEQEEEGAQQEQQIEAVTTTTTTSHQSSSNNAVGLVTNSVILSPQPNNPILLKFLERILQYSENSASTAQELKSRPEFSRVLPYMTNYSQKLGILGKDGTLLYSAHLWIFTDLVIFDKEMEAGKYLVDLPALRWTYDFIILPHMLDKFDDEEALGSSVGASSSPSSCDLTSIDSSPSPSCDVESSSTASTSIHDQLQNERIHTWNAWHILKRAIIKIITFREFDDPNLANYFVQDVAMFKTSTDGGTIQNQMKFEDFLNMKSTMGRLYRTAMAGTGMNATLEGARPFGYGALEACSFEFDDCW
eukprot:scaffold4383_cov145-Skeletonema_menzelii.AAC.6